MKRVDSDALGVVTRALGITGAGAPVTEFIDGQLEQTLDIAPIVRRGRALAATEGIFTGLLRNIHTDAESLVTALNPYSVLPRVAAIAPYPAIVPAQFDLWLLGAVLVRTSGGGTLNATLTLQYNAQGWGLDDNDAAVAGNLTMPLGNWDTFLTQGGFTTYGILAGSDQPFLNLGLRIPRAGAPELSFFSTSSLTVTITAQVILGLFPVALGQDAIV